jgi:hypothetical protein
VRYCFTIVALAFVAGRGVAQDAGPAGIVFKSEAGKFSVRLPGKPRETVKTIEKILKADVHLFQIADGDHEYAVSYTDLPPGSVEDADHQWLLDGASRGSAAAVQGQVAEAKKITLGKPPVDGLDFRIEYPKGYGRMRLFVKGDRMYQVGVLSKSKEWITSDAVTKYLDSFEIR